jgi:hypothetical protein
MSHAKPGTVRESCCRGEEIGIARNNRADSDSSALWLAWISAQNGMGQLGPHNSHPLIPPPPFLYLFFLLKR